jgi:hypothetical protein
MAKKKRLNRLVISGIIFLAVIYALLDITGSLNEKCVEGQKIAPKCTSDSTVEQYSCDGGVVKSSIVSCGEDSSCKYGYCFEDTCESNKKVCLDDFSYVKRICTAGVFTDTIMLCEEDEHCENKLKNGIMTAKCVETDSTCGDGICSADEDAITCVDDCSLLSDWAQLRKTVASSDELQTYTECVGAFDCDNSEVQNLAERIGILYNTKTPKDYVDAVNDYVFGYIDYQFNGGSRQCGETASSLINEKVDDGIVYGNCVDYSTLSVALLRSKGIPARQVGGCVSSIQLYCKPFAITPESLRHGGMNEEQPLAHAWGEVFVDSDIGWTLIDPTVGMTTSKCVGYNRISASLSSEQMCYLPVGYDETNCI